MSRIFVITRAAYSTALTPSGASEEWQVRPCTVTLSERFALWPITTSISVGSPTKQAIGFAGRSGIFAIDAARADAADLLVIREGKMQRLLQVRVQHVRHRREAARHVALHVGRAAAVQLAVAFGQLERAVGPVLVVDRHHVGVAREDEARHVGRPERRPQVRFLAGLVVDALVLHAELVEISLDPGDQVEIGVAAHGVEADQRGQDVFAALQVHVGSRWRPASCIAHQTDQGGVRHGWLSPAIHVFNVRVRRNDAMPDIKSLTAAELLRLYRRRELSPVEVTRDQLDRIDTVPAGDQRLHHRGPRRRARTPRKPPRRAGRRASRSGLRTASARP